MKKQTKVLSALAGCLCLSILLSGCGMSEWDATKSAMEKAESHDNVQRAVEVGQKYLSNTETPNAEIYGMMAEYYQILGENENCAEMLQKGYSVTGDTELYNDFVEFSGGMDALYPDLRENLYDVSKYEINGVAFSEMTSETLDAMFPHTEDEYFSEEDDGGWYRSIDYKNCNATISWYPREYGDSLYLEYYDNGYSNRYETEGPEIAPPAGAMMGDSRETVLQKCGVSQNAIRDWSSFTDITLSFEDDEMDSYFYTSDYEDAQKDFEIQYDNRSVYGEISFRFDTDDTLMGFRITWYP